MFLINLYFKATPATIVLAGTPFITTDQHQLLNNITNRIKSGMTLPLG